MLHCQHFRRSLCDFLSTGRAGGLPTRRARLLQSLALGDGSRLHHSLVCADSMAECEESRAAQRKLVRPHVFEVDSVEHSEVGVEIVEVIENPTDLFYSSAESFPTASSEPIATS